MKDATGPTKSYPLAEAALNRVAAGRIPDFSDTERTFRHLSDSELSFSAKLFGLMGRKWLTDSLATLGLPAVAYGLPGAKWMVRQTIFPQFVGGQSLEASQPVIDRLYERGVTSILDFGAEAKSTEAEFDRFCEEVKAAIRFSSDNAAAVAGVVKITGLADDEELEWANDEVPVMEGDLSDFPHLQSTLERLDSICKLAAEHNVQIYIDAEESWMQNTIDAFAANMMQRYNRGKVTVLHTYQLYRHDRLDFLKACQERARKHGYKLGAKLVRGAYMVKENEAAEAGNYPTPIQPSLEATHRDFNAAIRYCLENRDTIDCCIGSHNEESVRLTCELMWEYGMPTNAPSVQFAQLYGMSDNLTFNLAESGYNVSKYLVYGPVKEVLPYLVRRAQENTSVTGEMGRELSLVRRELERRG